MNHATKYSLLASFVVLAVAVWFTNTQREANLTGFLVSTAEARLGRPATPVSYAGVARRTTVRVATPGVGAPGVGARPGVGAGQAGVGAGQAGVGYSAGAGGNLGGPINRVGVR